MKARRWFRRLCCFYKILNNQIAGYLYSLLSPPNRDYNTSKYSKIRQIFCRTETFSNSFLPQTIREWNKLDTSICQAPSYSVFRKALLDFIRPTANSTFGTNDASGSKLLTRLRVGFSHLRNINLNIICKIHWTHCAHVPLKQKTPVTFSCTAKFFLINEMSFLMTLIQLTQEIIKTSENQIVQVLLFGNKCFSKDINFRIITSSIRFIEDSKRFDESLSTWEKPFWYIFTTGIKPKNIFSPSVSAFYVTYLLWRAVKFSFCACIVLYIYFFLSLV